MNKKLIIHSLILFVFVLITCKQLKKELMVSSGDVSNISTNSADVSGAVVDLGEGATQYGHCYSTAPNVTISGSKTQLGVPVAGEFISQLTNLTAGTKYYIKAYLTSGTVTVYGKEISFTTVAASLPTLTTTVITSITTITASGGGNITSNGGAPVTARGVCWNTATGPTTDNSKTTDGSGSGTFISNLTNLNQGTQYYVRAYATSSIGTSYGNEVTFSAKSALPPTLSTTLISGITQNSAQSGGEITDDGGASVTSRGVCWNTAINPTTANNKTSDGTGLGSFTSNITSLDAGTTYYVRAYATNIIGTSYGAQGNFITNGPPTVTTTTISGITQTTSISGGNITSDGGATVIARGVCWSTATAPSLELSSKTSDNPGTGLFTSTITGLTPNTTYYVRAYATNSFGTGYGNSLPLTTQDYGTVTDIDANVYKTITIGTQTWMAENLKTTKYNQGIAIPQVSDAGTWSGLRSPAYCWYNNDAVNYKAVYGAMYNWYPLDAASNGGNNVCPTGWHIPNDAEWSILSTYLGGETIAGGKLKETGTTHWQTPNSGADNLTSFTALPGGRRISGGSFIDNGNNGTWWSATIISTTAASFIYLDYRYPTAPRGGMDMSYGFSVRCVKDF